jgi:hypothetical protein
VLLRRSPLVAEAVVMGLAGQRFFDVYIPSIGLELRVHSEDIVPGPVIAEWDAGAKCACMHNVPAWSVAHVPAACPYLLRQGWGDCEPFDFHFAAHLCAVL